VRGVYGRFDVHVSTEGVTVTRIDADGNEDGEQLFLYIDIIEAIDREDTK
jgi:hypothetical protein